MSEAPQPAPVESNLPAPVEGMSYGATLDIATKNYANGMTESGIVTHVPEIFKKDTTEAEAGEVKDYLAIEMGLVEEYKGTPMAGVLANSLDELKRFAGIGIPKYSNVQREPSELDNVAEDLRGDKEFTEDIGGGFVELGSTNSPNAFVSMQLRPQQEVATTQEEFAEMSPAEQYNASKGKYGELIAGDELPTESRKFLDDLYKLIDAELVVDEPGERIYKGTYMGSEIYIEETESRFKAYTLGSESTQYTVFGAMMLGAERGASDVKGFSMANIRQITAMGMDWRALQKEGVTRDTLQGYLGSMREINALGDEIGDLGEVDSTIDATMSLRDATLEELRNHGVDMRAEDGTDQTALLAGTVAESLMDAMRGVQERSVKSGKLHQWAGKIATRFLRGNTNR